jgi:hypothetical protein
VLPLLPELPMLPELPEVPLWPAVDPEPVLLVCDELLLPGLP